MSLIGHAFFSLQNVTYFPKFPFGRIPSTESGWLLSMLFVLGLHKNGRTHSRSPERPFIEWLLRRPRIKKPLRFRPRSYRHFHCHSMRRARRSRPAGNDIARRRKFLVDFSTFVRRSILDTWCRFRYLPSMSSLY